MEGSKSPARARKLVPPKPVSKASSVPLLQLLSVSLPLVWHLFSSTLSLTPAILRARKGFYSSLCPQPLAQGPLQSDANIIQPRLGCATLENNTLISTISCSPKVHCKCSWVSKAAALQVTVRYLRQLFLCQLVLPSSTWQGTSKTDRSNSGKYMLPSSDLCDTCPLLASQSNSHGHA